MLEMENPPPEISTESVEDQANAPADEQELLDELLLEEVLIEDISIDGMCGVY
jgi:mycofactocin precursor